MIKTQLEDGSGSGRTLKIGEEGELFAVIHDHPPTAEDIISFPFIQYFADSGGVTDMRVNGSVTTQEFSINAIADFDLYVKTIAVTISDAGATLSKFGNLSSLSNGVQLDWITQDLGTVPIAESIKSNFEFLRLSLGNPSVEIYSNVAGASEGVLAVIDFEAMFGLKYGLRLRANTKDKISFFVRDNVSGVDQFDAIAYGIKI